MADLYTRIGGAAAVDAAVELLYRKLLAHDHVKAYFEGVDMKRLARHQTAFLTFAFGGGKKWTGPSMYRAHRKLIQERGLNTSHFDVVGEALVQVLQELSVPQELIDEVLAIVTPLRPVFDPAYQPTEADLAAPAAAAADSKAAATPPVDGAPAGAAAGGQ